MCGPPQYSEMRLNFAQAVQAVGTVVGPVLASQVFFKNVSASESSLLSVQWVYLGIAIFVFVLAGVFYVSTIPEITDADMERQMETTGGVFIAGETKLKPLKDHYQLWWGSFSQFCYVGAQGTCSAVGAIYISLYITATDRAQSVLQATSSTMSSRCAKGRPTPRAQTSSPARRAASPSAGSWGCFS